MLHQFHAAHGTVVTHCIFNTYSRYTLHRNAPPTTGNVRKFLPLGWVSVILRGGGTVWEVVFTVYSFPVPVRVSCLDFSDTLKPS